MLWIGSEGLIVETVLTIWFLLKLFSLAVVPQLLGVLLYFRIRNFDKSLAHAGGVLIPPVSFLILSFIIGGAFFSRIPPEHWDCGMAAGILGFFVLVVSVVQLFFSSLVQFALHYTKR